MSIKLREIYRSAPDGDVWYLARDTDSGNVFVRHKPNKSSGGQSADFALGAFLVGTQRALKSGNCFASSEHSFSGHSIKDARVDGILTERRRKVSCPLIGPTPSARSPRRAASYSALYGKKRPPAVARGRPPTRQELVGGRVAGIIASA